MIPLSGFFTEFFPAIGFGQDKSFTLNDEAISHFFTCISNPRTYANAACVSKQFREAASLLRPMHLYPSGPVRPFAFMRGLTLSEDLYSAFEERCSLAKIGADSKDFCVYVRAAARRFKKASDKTHFEERVYNNFVNMYGRRSLEKITVCSFRAKVEQIKELFPEREVRSIETDLRQSVAKNCTELKRPNSLLTKGSYERDLENRKSSYVEGLKREAVSLVGEGNIFEVRKAAHAKMLETKHNLHATKEGYLDRMAQMLYPCPFSRRDEFSSLSGLERQIRQSAHIVNPDPLLDRLGKQFTQLLREFSDAKKEFEELAIVCAKLERVDEDFPTYFRKEQEFYRELCQLATTDESKETQ